MTNAEARFNNSLRPRKPEGSLGRTAQDVHLDSHTAPELCAPVLPGGRGCIRTAKASQTSKPVKGNERTCNRKGEEKRKRKKRKMVFRPIACNSVVRFAF